MRQVFLAAALLGCLLSQGFAAQPKKQAAAPPKQRAKDEAAIRASVKSYVAAFNRGDATRLASHWSDDGEYITPDGNRITGRTSIEAAFKDLFAAENPPRLEVSNTQVKFVTEEVVIEEGTARVIPPREVPTNSTYMAVHVKSDGKWKLHSVREVVLPSPPSHYKELQQLEWMIGSWVDESEAAVVETVCEWTKNKNFITRSFKTSVEGMDPLEGTQVIGWDPVASSIRSWLFDSDGGFAEGFWSQDGNRWIVRTKQVLPDGRQASAVNVFTYRDQNTFTWQSTQRLVDGEQLPDVEEFPVVRVTNPR